MAYCGKCGTRCEEHDKFCPSCGTPSSVQREVRNDPFRPSSAAGSARTDISADARENKTMGIISYLFCLWFIPLIKAKDSGFARFHANQGLIVFILWMIEIIAAAIVNAVTAASFMSLNISSWGAAWNASIASGIIFTIVSILLGILEVIGILNAIKGQKKELPVIGKIRIIK